MSLTLLLDLDDTLLANNMDTFIPAYLGAFSRLVADSIDPQRFVGALLGGTRQMTLNRRPDCTLQDVFEDYFFPALQADVEQFRGLAERFYTQIFPDLRQFTRPLSGAVALVEGALGRGYRVAIATNPLFPLTAIHQRLAWAGLPVDQYAFEWVPSYETSHFCKPDPAYFAEILGYMGCPDGPVVMVGDDMKMDIYGARQAGIPAFWLPRDGVEPVDEHTAPTRQGELAEILPWLDHAPQESLSPEYGTPGTILATLRATPAVLHSLCRDLPDELWVQRPRPDEWCLTELACHLRDVDQEVNLPRIRKVLSEDNPFVPGRDTDPWAEERKYIEQDGRQALAHFTATRLKLLDTLEALLPEDWQRPARHAIFGPTLLSEIAGIIAAHDRLHIRQVKQVIADASV